MIRRWLRELPDRALHRIVEAPAEAWTPKVLEFADDEGRRCLCGHAEAWTGPTVCLDTSLLSLRLKLERELGSCPIRRSIACHRFPDLTRRIGLTRARELCQAAAMKELHRRWIEQGAASGAEVGESGPVTNPLRTAENATARPSPDLPQATP